MTEKLRLFAEIQGIGRPVLFLPGLGGNHRAFTGIQKVLSTRFQTFAIDPRDTGHSPRTDYEYFLPQMAEDVLNLMDDHQLNEVNVVGHSMGGMIAQHLALLAPQRIRSMVLMSCHAKNYPWKTALVQSWINLRQIVNAVEFTRFTMPWLLGPSVFENQAHIDGMIRHVERNPLPQEPEAFVRQGRAVLIHDLLDRLHTIEIPSLIVSGELDRVTPPETSQVLADHLPHSAFRVIANVGHLPHIEAPAEITSLLNGFIENPRELIDNKLIKPGAGE